MPRKTAGKLKSAKQIAAATKTILAFEKAQAYKNRVSDNLEVFMQGFVTAAIPLVLVIGYLLSV